jgi:hypothetical protein
MRLLTLQDDDELTFTEYISEEIPPYAILSHTWGADVCEVTHKDVLEGTGKNKAGYAKIYSCGKQAAKTNIQYFWVDTCCIDKTSSTELSEAINSMYCWYQKAEVCFVYLEDVSPGTLISLGSMSTVRWFLRGWTLQELVASPKVEFFANDWTFLGSKTGHSDALSSITGIHAEALCNKPVAEFSIAQRMSWASKRTTTRPEDIAYCLLGLFGVNMPLLYGEGEVKAFVRLQEEIMRDSDDQSIFAWTQPSTQSTTMRGLLADSPADFASSGGIIPIRDWRRSNPYSMTNAGLRITLLTTDPETQGRLRLGLLDCITMEGPKRLVALHLYQHAEQGDQYGRVNVGKMAYVSREHRAWCSYRTIFVRKQITRHVMEELLQLNEIKVDRRRLRRYLSIWRLQYSEARGELVTTVSALYVTLYHVVIMVGLMFGWTWWARLYPEDLQGASVPVTVMLMLVSVFWGTLI